MILAPVINIQTYLLTYLLTSQCNNNNNNNNNKSANSANAEMSTESDLGLESGLPDSGVTSHSGPPGKNS